MNLAGLRAAVRSRLGVPNVDAFFPPFTLDGLINQAIAELDDEALWPWVEQQDLFDYDPGVVATSLPDDWKATKAILIYDTGDELSPVTSTEIMANKYTGLPIRYTVIGDLLYLRPIPSSTLTFVHIYYRYETPLVADTDRPMIPDRFGSVIVAKAAQLGALREDDRAAATAHYAEYQAGVQRMRRSMRSNTKPTTIKVRPGGWV